MGCEVTRAWFVDFVVAVLLAVMVASVVSMAGGPDWAVLASALLVYLTHPPRRQLAERERNAAARRLREYVE